MAKKRSKSKAGKKKARTKRAAKKTPAPKPAPKKKKSAGKPKSKLKPGPAPAGQSDRSRQAEIMARKRRSERDIYIPEIVDLKRRAEGLKDPEFFLREYFHQDFYTPFSQIHKLIIQDIVTLCVTPGDQAEAAPRGEGKTTIAEKMLIRCICYGLLSFPLIVGPTGPHAEQIQSNIKTPFEFNDLLHEDFPEICAPIRALEGANQRAGMQTYQGKRTRIKWSDKLVVFPTIEGSAASGIMMTYRGADAAIRGLLINGRRPDFALIDDLETRESAESEHQIKKRMKIVDQDLGGLAGIGHRISRLMLTTLMNRYCASAQYTDRKLKPSWNGRRHKMMITMPERMDLVETYIDLRQVEQESGDKSAAKAHQYYIENQDEIEAGAEPSNPYRYLSQPGNNGDAPEVSATQHALNIIADFGWDTFNTEYQNEPPKENEDEKSGISATIVSSRVNGFERGVMPRDTVHLTCFIDLGTASMCHWSVVAWQSGFTGLTIDYDAEQVHNSRVIGPELAIKATLNNLRDKFLREPYVTEDGEERHMDLILIDSGFWTTTAYEFAKEMGLPFRVSKGFGKSKSLAPYHHPDKKSRTKRPGDNWYESKQDDSKIWLVNMNADYWKGFVHDRFLTSPTDEKGKLRPGSMTLWGDEPRDHRYFGKHIVAEERIKKMVHGANGGLQWVWVRKSKQNHWFDTTYGNCVAASMLGMTISGKSLRRRTQAETAGKQWFKRQKGD